MLFFLRTYVRRVTPIRCIHLRRDSNDVLGCEERQMDCVASPERSIGSSGEIDTMRIRMTTVVRRPLKLPEGTPIGLVPEQQ